MNIEVLNKAESNISYRQIVELLHESFQERLRQGLHYSCSSITIEEYIEKTKNGVVYVAIDKDTEVLAGTCTLNIFNEKSIRYGYMEFVGVAGNYKHKGVGMALLQRLRYEAKEILGFQYILSDTSVDAVSAVSFHLKNGFRIIGLESYRSTNYWSYVFRLQLAPSILWHNSLFLKCHYWCSYAFMKVTRKIDGSDTWAGTLYKRTRHLCRN